MINFIMSFVIAMVSIMTPWSVYAASGNNERADELIKKYTTTYERPKSCPMESKRFTDLIAKTEAIKDVLKGNCLKKDNDKMTEVLDSIKDIQDELKNQAIVANNSSSTAPSLTSTLANLLAGNTTLGTAATGTATDSKSLDGMKYSKLFSNITTMFKKSQCSMEDGRVLEMTADLIYDSTQIGVLAGNTLGLAVAGAGFLVSSALRLIDLIIKKRFDFDKPTDRQTFVKLNCSFYEIRRELEVQGAFDIENSTSREDYRDTKAMIEEMLAELKKIEEEKINIARSHTEIDRTTFELNVGDVTELRKILVKVQKYLQPGVNATSDVPTETQKLLMISQLAQDYDALVEQLKSYKNLKISSIPMLEDVFISELKKFDSLNVVMFIKTMNMSANDFNENHRAKILFHIMRIDADISKKGNTLSEKSQKIKTEFSTSLDKRKADLATKIMELRKVEAKLGGVVNPRDYSGLDDGSENMISILDNHKKISGQIYGEWGEKFLKFSTYKSIEEVKNFKERISSFNKKYDDLIKGKKAPISYACQDAQKLRLIFKHADSLVQEGFDFVATNKDIIYSDVKNYYNGNINEETGRGLGGPIERIQRHYKSAIVALKQMKGEEIAAEDQDKYLDKSTLGSYLIGYSMLEVAQVKKQAKSVQDVYDRLNCQKTFSSDLE